MKRALTKANCGVWFYKDGVRVEGVHEKIMGDVSGLSGDVSCLRGNVTGLRGDVDDCEISDEERKNGVNVDDLVSEDNTN